MGNKIITEADRKRTAPAPASATYTPLKKSVGQKCSRGRGSHTNNKKNPGKRPHQG
ncbi:MAG: hypothetical protein ACH34Y_04775 [Brachymonas sp.]